MECDKSVLTTGEVARICNVAPRTVSKWFDSGQLRGYRIPGGKDRRIPTEQLIRFMRANGIPLNGLDGGGRRVLVLEGDASACRALCAALGGNGRYEVSGTASAFEAGFVAGQTKPHVIVVDVSMPDVDPAAFVRDVRAAPDLNATRLIGVATGLTPPQGQALLQAGFDAFLAKPYELRKLIDLVDASPETASLHVTH